MIEDILDQNITLPDTAKNALGPQMRTIGWESITNSVVYSIL
jgi:hypothetical protein